MSSKTTNDEVAGCLVVIAFFLIVAGGTYAWGPLTLVVAGIVILLFTMIAKP
jgi:hypothetical protein